MTNYDYLYNKDAFGDSLNRNHFHDRKLHFKIIENGTVLPFTNLPEASGFGGIIDSKANFIEGSSLHKGNGGPYTPTGEVRYVSAPVVYMGMFYHSWGHCLTDDLKRVWFLNSETYKRNFKNYPLIWAPMAWGGVLV